MKHLVIITAALGLTACGYGWKDEASNAYPPSSGNGEVVQGQGAASAGPGEYLVQPGDTLFSIGFRNQLDYHDIAEWNGIGRDYRIRSGQVLRLTPPVGTNAVISKPAQDPDAVVARPLPQAAPSTQGPKPIPPPTATTPLMLPGPVALPPLTPAVPVISVAAVPVQVSMQVPMGNATRRWQWPTNGSLLKQYNMAAGSKGIDISGELGQPVEAVAAGKVVYSGSALKGYGELIIVKHDDTYLSAYGHNRRRLVKEGDEVRAGQTIAELGLGPEQKPLVHFEIRENGKPVDPLGFLPSR